MNKKEFIDKWMLIHSPLSEKEYRKDKITIQRIYGEWQGMLEGICQQDIPQRLKDKLQEKIEAIRNK